MKFWILLLCFSSFSSMARAANQAFDSMDQTERELRKLDDREMELKKKMADLEEVAQRVGVLAVWRDQIFLGKDGIKARTDAWMTRAQNWLQSWSVLVDLAIKTDVQSSSGLAAQITDLMNSQSDALIALQKDGQDLKKELGQRRLELDQLKVFPARLFSGREAVLQTLVQNQQDLRNAFAEVERAFNVSGVDTLRTRYEAIVQAIDAQFRQRLLEFPELKASIDMARDILLVSSNFRPRVMELERQALASRTMGSQYGFQSAAKSQAAMEVALAKLIQDLQARHPRSAVAQDLRLKAEAAVKKSKEHLQRLTQAMNSGMAFQRFMQTRRALLTRDCRNPELQSLRDCELLRSLNSLPINPDSIKQFSEADMLYIEEQIEAVSRGPSFVRKNQ